LDFSVFDWAVNSGPSRSAKALQKLVDVTPDGAIGPLTLAAVRTHSTSDLISEFSKERELFYRRLRTFSTFGKGWLNRLDKTQKKSYELLLDVPLTPV
jgi:lysozyme family protein